MITIFKDKNLIPEPYELVMLNDVYFNQDTCSRMDERADDVIEEIDCSKRIGKFKIQSRFNGVTLDIDKLSTGCKTVLNVMYNPKKVFCTNECGENALSVLYGLDEGTIFSEYANIPLDMTCVRVVDEEGAHVIDDYETLKEWWNIEN